MIGELFKKYREQITYLFFGVMTTAVNYVTYWLCSSLILGEDSLLTVSQTIAWLVSVLFAFITNKFCVFKGTTNEHIAREFLTFFGARAASGLIEIGGFALFVDMLHFNDWIVKIAIAVFVVIFNYVLSKFLIFKK